MSDLPTRLEGMSRKKRTALLELLRKKKGDASAAPVLPVSRPPRAPAGDLPLSFAQQRLWFIDRLAPGSPLYNVPGSMRCTGRLDPAVLAACLSEVVRRHDALRTRFEIRGDGPVQIVEPPVPLPLPLIDLAALPDAVRTSEAERIIRAENLHPFDLARPPLLRARLLRLRADEHLFSYVFHHIASDGWSLDVAVREVAALYPAFLERRPSPLPELPLQYADFAWGQVQALHGEALERELAWWRPRLAGAPVLELPTDRPRPAVPSFRGGARLKPLAPALEAGLRELAREERATLFMTWLAPLSAFLGRLAGTTDVVVGTVVMGRERTYLQSLIGFFVNTLVLRFDGGSDPDRATLLAQCRDVVLGAFGHQALPFEKLVDELGLPRDPYRPPLLRVLFQFFPLPPAAAFPDLTLEPYRLPSEMSKFDLLINAMELNGRLLLDWRYDADLFEAETISRWAGTFDVLLGAWLKNAALRWSELPLLTPAERDQILTAWNPEPVSTDRGRRSLPELFEAQVDRTPDAVALSADGFTMSYRELDARAGRLARWLARQGVVPGDRVALRLDRSPELVVALLAVLKTGAAYVPLDPSAPEERLAFTLQDSGASLLLDAALLQEVDRTDPSDPSDRSDLIDPELPAYVIYTSGSTGRPKGVVVPHGAVTRLFSATDAWFGFGPGDVWTLFHSYAFDFSVWEIWGALLYGGRLVVVPWSVSRDPEAFLDLLAREGVTVLNQTPSAFRQLIGSSTTTALRWVIFGGEALDPSMLAPWFDRHGDQQPRLVNMYGITETTVHVTFRPLSRKDAASLIGRPIPDLTVHVLDQRFEPQPLDIPGELCVGGEGLAQGYLGRPDLTAAQFVPDPHGQPGSRLYRSGDLARRRPDGDLEYLGRIDHQVKIRGFRIELGEIEAALVALPGVREAVVLAREGRLVAYVTAERDDLTLSEMREALARRLPDYMIPSALVVLDRLPLTSNGKIDRRALPSPDAAPAAASGHAHVPPRDALEEHLAGLFRQILNVPAAREIGALDDFFELGGSSISGAILINRLQETLGEIVHVVVIFDHSTVEALAAYVRAEHPAAAARIWGVDTSVEVEEEAPAGPSDLAEMRRLIVEGREPEVEGSPEPLNPSAVFVLSPPRSGSTLLRLMLGAHPRLFAPPELELLSFQTLAGREAAFAGRDRFWLEGVTRAVMEARSCDVAEAERIVAAATAEGRTTRRFYRELQGWIGGRLLVDKTPSYALDPAILRRGEAWFAETRYIHLLRHPQATNRSFEEARLDQIFFRRPHRFARRQLAELIWTVSHRNILDFLTEIPAARQHTVRFEDLVREPGQVLAGVCGFLGLEYDPAMADPYRDGAARMADGVHAESRMLGDVKFLAHGRVDAAAAERWRQAGTAPLGEPARQLAAELAYSEDHALVPVPRTGSDLPLSFAQQRLWFLDRLQPGTPTYNIPSFFRLVGRLDPGLLERVLGELVRRHESLRTTFHEQAGEPRQRIHPPAPPHMPRVDLGGLPEDLQEGEVRLLAREESGRGFSLENGPLLRVTLLRLDEEEHVLLTTVHHIVSDGWSTGVLAREVSILYDAFRRGTAAPLPELPVQYADFAVWQRHRLAGTALEAELLFWRRRLADLPAVLELPTDRPRLAVQGFRGALTPLVLDGELSAALAALGRRERMTPFMTLLAAFQVLLGRVTGQERFGVGTPVAGRNRLEIEPLIGFFVNTLVLRADLSAEPAFLEVLRRVREEALEAQRHQELPFEKLVEGLEIERSLSHTPLFQAMFAFQNAAADARLDLPGLSLLPLETGSEVAKFDLGLTLGGGPEGLAGAFDFSTDLFDGTTIQRLAGQFETLLAAMAADPGRPVWDVPLLAPAQSHQLLVEWNDTKVPGEPTLLHRLVEEQAARTPGAVALEAGGVRRTYAELIEQARRYAEGVAPGTIVPLAAERTPELIAQMLGVLQAGAAYLPVDPAYPEERRAFMVAEAKDIKDARDSNAYVIYTSGSTGRPKGVVVPYGAIAAFVRTAQETYGIGPGDRVLQFASLSFDTSGEEIWPALASGATLVLRSEEMLSSIPQFLRELERLGITVLDLPTAFWHEMVLTEELDLPLCLRLVIIGGEEARADRLALWHRRVGSAVRLINTYGPTETTIVATRRELAGLTPGGTVPIGRPISGARVYVLDRHFAPVPPGVRGELWIGGAGVARGYLGRPDLTADRFRPDPFRGIGARLYRTGDLAFLRPDGDLVFAGRADRQVKLRGYRIELGEIEAALVALPGVREAAVVAREDRLVAYVASDLPADLLRQSLRGRLPDYMVPSAFVTLAALPLTPNGKVDRKALPAPEGQRAEEGSLAPRTPVEATLAGLFVEILGTERTGGRVGVQDSFFDLGGHSLLATRLVAAVRDIFRVDLPLRLLFEQPTVEGLAQAIEEAGKESAPIDEPVAALPRGPGENRFPVSFAQLREWILDRLEPGNPAYNIAGHLRIEGPLSVPVLTAALQGLVRRHEVFRTVFISEDDEPLQVVLPEVRLDVPVIDLSPLPEGAREAELRRRIREEDGTGFDLSAAPLLRARIVRLGPADHVLLMTVHHIVSDGWSMSILNQELAALYEAQPLPELPVQYADYAVWQRRRLSGEALERQAGFWRQRLAGAPPLLQLPTDRPRPPVRSSRGGRVPFVLPQPLAGRLEELARRRGVSLFMVLLASYQTLLARWSGQEDIVVGTYNGSRPRRELEGLIGFFIETLALRTDLTGDPSFAELVRRVRETILEAYAHRDVPFEKLLEVLQLPRDPSRTPLFQALLVLQNFPPTRADLSTGVRLTGLAVEREKSDYDLALWLGDGPEGIAGAFQYSTDLFDEATIVRCAGHLRALLEAAVADPERNIWTLPLVGTEEEARDLAAWSRGPAVPAGPSLLHLLVEEQAARTPGAVAVEAGSVRLTYAELVEQARRFAGGVAPGSIVALSAERTPELIVQMLGVLQAGAAYLPVDPAYPQERRAYMVEDSGAVVETRDIKVTKDNSGGAHLLPLVSLMSFEPSPETPAYLIYTSGSTGHPKGVVVPHRAIASFVRGAREAYELRPGDRVLQFASISFDTSAEEIWPALASGATLVLRPEKMAASIPYFVRELGRLGITVLDLPTAFWHEMVAVLEAEDLELPGELRLVILGGEEALADRCALWHRRVGASVRLVNTYGPTETTIVATRRELAGLAPGRPVPIGRPISGVQAHVLDRFLAPVPPGVRGELWIGGSGVAQGYLGRPDLTADRFRPDPFGEEPGARLYRTGDLAVLTPDGDLVFAGRADRQLKIRGYRIEPGEIEAALRLHPAVRDAVVEARGPGDSRRLVAWIVPAEGAEAPGAVDLRAFLRGMLPDPLVPAAFATLAELPLTPSGKVDRQALMEPLEARPDSAAAEPQSDLERTIAGIYGDLLRVAHVGLHDSFFDLGGHSLLIVRAHQKLKEALGREIPVVDLFRFPTVASLARHLGGEETGQLRKVQGLAEQQRAAQQRQRAAMERLRGRTERRR